ncbi:signal peptidase complex subunit 3A-like [Telopea speciosissima]|uniref:signal peptidase complex subunit 3A-like n=1 Tax=Telopea speciosissima TaxID=54955 RepID=UPI001CC616AE|nr:signal peptidase complex subunit 3A-like [Telopea speciosissima]
MHSFGHRFNTLIMFSGFLLVLLWSLASVTDIFNVPSVHGRAEVLKINRFRKQLNGNDEVTLTLNMSMDLCSTFTWNTKQVFVFLAAEYETPKNSLNQISLWDHIILNKDQAKFETRIVCKYPLIDQGSNLRGKKIKLVLHWYVMPKTGRTIADMMVMSDICVPQTYT